MRRVQAKHLKTMKKGTCSKFDESFFHEDGRKRDNNFIIFFGSVNTL